MKQWPSNKTEYVHEGNAPGSGEMPFSGFKNLNSTPIPDEFFDVLAVQLSEAELRVLLYIMRRTFGFKKKADAISLSQLTGGIRKRDGSILDHGTGLSKPAVLKAVSGLQAKGIITIEKRTGEDGRNEINVYQLRFADEPTNASPSPFVSQRNNSTVDYSTTGHNQYLSPDPRFVSARPVAPVSNRPASPGTLPGFSGEQRQAGDFRQFTSTDYYGQESEFTTGVNQLYREGKPNLLSSKNQIQGSKQSLPGVVNRNNRGSQIEAGKGVNPVNRQHESLQDSRKQNTETQTVWQANGALAFQPALLEEMVEDTPGEDELYINLEELAGEMYELGLSQKLVFDFIQAYPPEYLWEKVRLTRQQLQGHQPAVKNAAGYLRRAITEDYRPQPPTTSRNSRPATNFADRFQGTLAYLNRNQPETPLSGQRYPGYSLPLEEDIYPEEIAPRPSVYRQDYNYQAPTGESRTGMPPSPQEVGPGSRVLPGRGATGGSGSYLFRSAPSVPVEDAATGLWEKIYEDLEGRFRLGANLELLQGALLFLPGPDDCENSVILQLSSPWQERALGRATRSAIALAVRQRLGPGFRVNFCSAGLG